MVLIAFFLLFSDVFVTLRYVVLACTARPADTIPSQAIRDNFKKQNARVVLWDPGIGEVNYICRIIFCRDYACCGSPCGPDRHFQHVCDLCEPPTHVCSDFNWHCVWYVLEFVPVTCRRSLITGNIQTYPPSSSSFGTRTAIRGHSSFRR